MLFCGHHADLLGPESFQTGDKSIPHIGRVLLLCLCTTPHPRPGSPSTWPAPLFPLQGGAAVSAQRQCRQPGCRTAWLRAGPWLSGLPHTTPQVPEEPHVHTETYRCGPQGKLQVSHPFKPPPGIASCGTASDSSPPRAIIWSEGWQPAMRAVQLPPAPTPLP